MEDEPIADLDKPRHAKPKQNKASKKADPAKQHGKPVKQQSSAPANGDAQPKQKKQNKAAQQQETKTESAVESGATGAEPSEELRVELRDRLRRAAWLYSEKFLATLPTLQGPDYGERLHACLVRGHELAGFACCFAAVQA